MKVYLQSGLESLIAMRYIRYPNGQFSCDKASLVCANILCDIPGRFGRRDRLARLSKASSFCLDSF
jgi:hypothetical protein